ncbi:MAG: Glu-tRNA(Gln) amidotransferase GatDE subunit D [Candidatus Diapherotrites archaeon]|uniref:Glutamyl-tRNA(Gln) amidotransferase subunit D n=1 Tax=Candidatus Iainarchaeum sp. TaxID=3101447 RepID=A0A2D6M1S3_9ARCH|nr:Glu-tRNA(Gln) amidotransferase GatDE subunit D [Candidatus Diapherotrites archaeon]
MDLKSFLKKNKLKKGDIVEVIKGKASIKGTIVPSKDPKLISLKLNSGYNTGIIIDTSINVKKIGVGKEVGKAKTIKFKKNPSFPTVSVLQIGGTIASRVDYRTGAVYTSYTPEDLITSVPELVEIANIESRLVSNMFSEDMRFAHYTTIAKEIEKEVKKGVKGIILPHGTDTMTYTSAALAFILKDLPIPVILVGAQRSTDRGSTDAIMNLICAVEFIAKTDFAGVGICMHETTQDDNCVILPACKTRKLHTSKRNAFKPVNDTAIARINFNSRKIEFIKKDYQKRNKSGKLRVMDKLDEKVALLKVHPNLMAKQIEFFKKNKYNGLVLEGTGLGQAPVGTPNPLCKENKNVMKAIEDLIKSGCTIIMTSQCIFGRIQMHVYSNAVDLVNAGVIPGQDMLPETAFIKLAWLLGNYKKSEVKDLVVKNLRGEISECTPINEPELG